MVRSLSVRAWLLVTVLTVPAAGQLPGGISAGAGSSSISDDESVRQFHAVVRPVQMASLPPQVAGTISEVHVYEGQYVQQGDPLITLDDRIARARLHVATIEAGLKGGLHRAEVQLSMAERRLERIRTALAGNAAAQFELEAAVSERDQAKAVVEQQQDALQAAEAQRRLAEAQLQQFVLVAPFDGLVTRLHQLTGAVDPSRALVTVANLDELEAEVHVPARQFGSVRRGQQVHLQAGAPISRLLTGKVTAVAPVIDAASDTFRCRVRIQNTSVQLPAGFTVVLQPLLDRSRDQTAGQRPPSTKAGFAEIR